jgi:hypothetical protein
MWLYTMLVIVVFVGLLDFLRRRFNTLTLVSGLQVLVSYVQVFIQSTFLMFPLQTDYNI